MVEAAQFNGQPIQGIVFDKDGTLFDFRATWTNWAQVFLLDLARGDADRACTLGQAIGFDTRSGEYHPQSPVVAGTPVELAELLLPHLQGHTFTGLLSHMNESAAQAPLAEAAPLRPLLADLSGMGLRLGVATNDAESPARAHLSAAGVLSAFDFVAGSDSGFGAKPAPGQLQAFCEAFAIEPKSVVMIGDSCHDLLAGRAAGMATIGVLTGPAKHDDLIPHADAVLDHIGLLPSVLAHSCG